MGFFCLNTCLAFCSSMQNILTLLEDSDESSGTSSSDSDSEHDAQSGDDDEDEDKDLSGEELVEELVG